MSVIPDNFLRLISPANRKALGKAGQTAEEAMEAFTARSEKELQEQIASLLRLRGIAFYRCRMDRKTTGILGWPDFTLAINGKAVAMEVKHGSNKLDPHQERCIALMRANGWNVQEVRSLQEAKMILDELTPTDRPEI